MDTFLLFKNISSKFILLGFDCTFSSTSITIIKNTCWFNYILINNTLIKIDYNGNDKQFDILLGNSSLYYRIIDLILNDLNIKGKQLLRPIPPQLRWVKE